MMRSVQCLLLLLIISFPLSPHFATKLSAQELQGRDEQLSFVGMRLADLFARFGTPSTVFAARGVESWQDDVVFQYPAGEFYVYRDRVWQVKLTSVCGVSLRDSRRVALLTLGDEVQDKGDHLLLPQTGAAWPLMLRVNLDNAGNVAAIYVYRSDY
ncbi:MAG: hypothetical protein LBH44_06300 [Treponema sp.]|jgi:hypothetical protein|nr:hypothetical protein [Treponema sp.]